MNTLSKMRKFFVLSVVLTNITVTAVSADNDDFCITDLKARTKNKRVRLTWTHNNGSTEYRIERSEFNASEGFIEIGVSQTTSATYVDRNIVLEKDYWYRILNSNGCPSTPVHVFFPKRSLNHPPSIESTPPETAETNVTYTYSAIGLDPEKKKLTWKLDIAPAGMSINEENGTISWIPTAEFKDSMVCVLLRSIDESGVSDQQFFTVSVNGQIRKTSCHTFFGPIQLKPANTSFNNINNELIVPSWIVPPYELHIFNGNPDGTQRISSARIEINGTQILNSKDINQTIAKISHTLTLKRL
ncbi:MAG: putative Ig domain-containing protein, partial [Chitinispirillia bacterium]